jgi:hypothetical protein
VPAPMSPKTSAGTRNCCARRACSGRPEKRNQSDHE